MAYFYVSQPTPVASGSNSSVSTSVSQSSLTKKEGGDDENSFNILWYIVILVVAMGAFYFLYNALKSDSNSGSTGTTEGESAGSTTTGD